MFDGSAFPKPLDEELFDTWLENGRLSKLSYTYLVIVWDESESQYQPAYVASREELKEFEQRTSAVGRESLVAAYDLYSESRVL